MTMTWEQADRLRDELIAITVHPETHRQGLWFAKPVEPSACGTFGCLAGNAVVNAGYELEYYATQINVPGKGLVPALEAEYLKERDQDGSKVTIREKARELFGLDQVQASRLFAGGNDLSDLWNFAIRYSDGQIDVRDVVYAFERAAREVRKTAYEKARAELTEKLNSALKEDA